MLIDEEKAGAENLKMALDDLEEKFDRIDPRGRAEIVFLCN